ncbi:MAG: prolyl oligopeptidase family serine peptidase [Planctomycetaceae bacterium]
MRLSPTLTIILLACMDVSLAQESGSIVPPSAPSAAATVLNEHLDIQWIGEEDRYAWYQAERRGGVTEVVVIDLHSGRRLDAKDFPAGVPKPTANDAEAAVELPAMSEIERSRTGGAETEIEFINRSKVDIELKWIDPSGKRHPYGMLAAGQSRKQHTFVNHVWLLCDRAGAVFAATKSTTGSSAVFTFAPSHWPLKELREAPRRRQARRTTDRESSPVFVKDFNLWTRDPATGVEAALTTDGNQQHGYEGPIWWAPSDKHFAVMRTRFAETRNVALVDSAPDDQVQPKTISIDYAKPGDRLDHPQLCQFDADGTKRHELPQSVTPNPFGFRDVSWRGDGQAVRLVYNERGHQRLQVIEFDLDGGHRVLVDERSETFIDYAGKYYLRFLDESQELIWMSERDGWNHLYLINQSTGQVKRQLTQGNWVVREVVEVDTAKRTMLIAAGGMVSGEDPYHLHLVRISLDGGEPVRLTAGDGMHAWEFSPGKHYFTDCCSRVDMPPQTVIRSLDTGKLIASAEVGDASGLLASGWTMPKRFVAKGRDGITDIHGIIVFPSGFDEAKRYPVLELIYAGPHAAHVPKSFQRLTDLHQAADGADGKSFIIVRIDGMGTSHRSKAFHDVCWKNLGDAGLPDRILWMKAAATEVPQMDLQRVGVWGGSAGGQSAVRALTHHGDFYKAAFADCGCHDNRMDKIWWNELWMGWPVGPHYQDQSNVTHAHRIRGDLMLSVGELDTNVDPASTLQLVDALIKADKDFELLYFPGAGHGVGSGKYGTRRRIDFFSRAFY